MGTSKKYFRPRARILELLGEQLIKSHTLALFELIKNSFDADAEQVDITLLNINKNDGEIKIQDDGIGMDLDTVENIWMEPAHGHKAIKRSKGEKTPKGRLPIGEKGVGRFAVHRLGTQITMVTKMKNCQEIYVNINWDDIQAHEYLDQALVEIVERDPEVFTKKGSQGTRITISGLREKWFRGETRRLYRSVMSMTSPTWGDEIEIYDKILKIKKDVFNVDFSIVPENEWLNELLTPEVVREQAMFFYDFLIDETGFYWQYKYEPLPGLKSDFKKKILPRDESAEKDTSFEFFRLKPPKDGDSWRKERSDRDIEYSKLLESLGIGPIRGRVSGFDLDKEILARYVPDNDGLSRLLKRQGGMRVYRDGMRVYDYGEEGNDWLGLDHRRFQQPTKRLSNNLILGEIYLDLEKSTQLIEKTNREGFKDNNAYRELRYAVLCALSRFEVERTKDKNIIRECFDFEKEGKPDPKGKSPEDAIRLLKEQVLEKRPHKDLLVCVANVEKTYKETRDVLLSAVGTGLGLGTVFHEIERGVRGLYRAIKNERPVEQLLDMAKSLDELLKGATFFVSKNESKTFKASELVQYALFGAKERLEYHKIPFRNGFESMPKLDFKITGVRRMYIASLSNLIDNAIHWIKMASEKKERKNHLIWIGPSNDLEGPSIVVADSGPGFEDPPEDIIQPFFTRRSDGMGIGLYYSNMVMKSHNGRLSFPGHSDVEVPEICKGAIVAMTFAGKN